LTQDALKQFWQFQLALPIYPFSVTEKLQQPTSHVSGTPVGMTVAGIRTFQVHHDEVHRIKGIGPSALSHQTQTEPNL
jgi:hypothetical protein